MISIFQEKEVKPGLSILPSGDKVLYSQAERSDRFFACKNCGHVQVEVNEAQAKKPCNHCNTNYRDTFVFTSS